MKREDIQKIKEKISILMGMRMVDMDRWDDSMLCGFTSAHRSEEIV